MSPAEDKYSIQWQDYKNSASSSFGLIREEKHLSDVTLVTSDEALVDAHKVVLSATSKFFKNLFKKLRDQKPVIYLGTVTEKNLNYLMEYIYTGETQVIQQELDEFLKIAQNFQINGLHKDLEKTDKMQKKSETPPKFNPSVKNSFSLKPRIKTEVKLKEENLEKQVDTTTLFGEILLEDGDSEEKRKVTPLEEVNMLIEPKMTKIKVSSEEEVDRIVIESSEKVGGLYHCKHCVYKSKFRHNTAKHIETHLEGLTYTCSICDKQYTSRNSLYQHQRIHKNEDD